MTIKQDILEITNQIKVNDKRAEAFGFISPSDDEKAERLSDIDSVVESAEKWYDKESSS